MRKAFKKWEEIFNKRSIDPTKDVHYISADEIKELTGGTEPRIMAKMDSTNDLPPIFKKHGYFLLPVKNGHYAIVRGEGFHELENLGDDEVFNSEIQFNLETSGRGSGEMQYLDYAYYSGALSHVLNSEKLYPTIRGREYTKPFSFWVNDTKLETSSVQIEVDSGLEDDNSIFLIEAKVGKPEDFIIRQIFYPYKNFLEISSKKEIVPIFFTYDPDEETYNYWVYKFQDADNYNSIQLKNKHSLKIKSFQELSLDEIKPESIPYQGDLIPQANDVEKIIEFTFRVSEGVDNYVEMAKALGFKERQSSYYREAAEGLGLIVSKSGKYKLTDVGRKLVSIDSIKERNLFMAQLLQGFGIVREVIKLLNRKDSIGRDDLVKLIADNSNLSGTTVRRRAQSLSSWLRWLAKASGTIEMKEGKFKLSE